MIDHFAKNSGRYEKRYEEDSRLPHLILEDILYFEEERASYFRGTLDLFGHCSAFDADPKGKLFGVTTSRDVGEITISATTEGDGYLVILDEDRKYLMGKDKLDALTAFLAVINKPITDRRTDFKCRVLEHTSTLKEQPLIMTLFRNFLASISADFFMDRELLAGTELIIENKCKDGKMLFVSTEELRKSTVHYTETTKGDKTTQHQHINRSETLTEYFHNHDLLVSVMMKRHGFDSALALYATHTLLLETAIEYYSDLWRKDFGHLFLNVEAGALKDLIATYVSIDSIQHEDLVTAGKFVYFLMQQGKFENNANFIDCSSLAFDQILTAQKIRRIASYESRLLKDNGSRRMCLDVVDLMNGREFEQFVCSLFSRMGYSTETTKETGDQGIDIIAAKDQIKIGVQTKCYSGVVANSAIQEVVAGTKHYGCDKAIVVTNNFFTKSAVELAKSNDVVLWDRTILKEKIADLF